MTDLDFKSAHQLNAVLGWLELGNVTEAREELNRIGAEVQERPDLLEVRWILDARQEDWPAALCTAERLVKVAPDNSSGWLHRAYAIRRVPEGSVEKAAQVLRPAMDKFPTEPTIPYNLACYECVLGNLDGARTWLDEAARRGSRKKIRTMALRDEDLEPLWPEIRKWK
ncbi:MAG TPA: tetratricopeptide repeat protein [Candidatus Kapabacteria bacterium]|nr:tetratricopeptide repeat protein [Candidatus Kapabacteria bacterium]